MRAISLLLPALLACTSMAAQQPSPGRPVATVAEEGIISAMGRSEAKTPPDRATVEISVQTRASTAAQAAADNARRQQAILDTLRSLGLGNDQLSTTNYQIFPDMRHERDREPRVIGYVVTNTVRAEVRQLDRVGSVLDAAIAKGANMITSLSFYASNTDAPRRQALAAAVASARGDAEAMARAAGGSLGRLLELTTSGAEPPIIMRGLMAASREMVQDAPTPIEPGDQTITARVTGRWEFVAQRRD